MATILVVDDEKENRAAMKRSLTDENPEWAVLTADGYDSAVQLIRDRLAQKKPVDVLLTDLVMADEQSGMRLLQEVQTLDPTIMAILFTAKERSLDRYKAFDYGAFDVIEKNIRGSSAAREINIKTRAALRYREWSQRVTFMRRYFDPRVFETISRDPSVLALGSRLITICFWDVRGFSLLCEILKESPALIAGFLRDYSEAGAKAVFNNGGVLDKFIGDGIMGLFGVLNGGVDEGRADALKAVRAGAELRATFADVLKVWMPKWSLYTPQKIEIGIGCGIHTGEALVGNLGADFREQFTAVGAHVNFAARLEARAKADEILVSQSTYVRIAPHVKATQTAELSDIKNIPGTFSIFNVESIL